MAATLEKARPERATITPEELEKLVAGGDGGDAGPSSDEAGGGRAPQKQWPLIPAVVVVVAVGALLTFLGMLTQIWANLSGAQLPGS